uniref:Transthyretin-like family protein n=1 Tax=Steinernema glaseri TaxID=37863 RepID=A0A1I8AU86_9BILA
MKSFLAFFLLASVASSAYGKMQNITVLGQVICDKKTLSNIKVELRERDTLDPDDTLQAGTTARDGKFRLFGKDNEITSITPYLRITHSCEVPQKKGKKCERITDIDIPQSKVGTVFNMNFVNMNVHGHTGKVVCK